MSLPLEGLKVLDFSTLLPGPYASMMLADMGAKVVKVESPSRPDMLQGIAPLFTSDKRQTSYASLTLDRNKRSLTLDLKNPDSVEAIKRLVKDFDVVIEQFRPGVMAKLGLDFSVLSKANPKLIYCSITGYGQTGHMANKAGHDINYLALSGLASYSGDQQSGPKLSGTQIADIAGGAHHAVMGILAALVKRNSLGIGQYLDISMTDAAFSLNAMFGAGALATGKSPELGKTLLNGGCFYDYYQTSDNRYLSIGGLEPKFASEFFQLIGHASWFKRHLSLNAQHQAGLKSDIQSVIGKQSMDYWMALFTDTDVCVEPVLSVTEAAQSELFEHRQMLTNVEVDGEKVPQIACPIKFGSAATSTAAAPIKGEYNQELLTEMGFSLQQIKEMTNEK